MEATFINLPPWEYYASEFQRRDLFSPVEKRPVVGIVGTSEFRVKGLMFGLHRSVVLEDARIGRILFLAEGECEEQIYVKKIGHESVILEIAGSPVVLDMKGRM